MNHGGWNQYKRKPVGCIVEPSSRTVNPVPCEESFEMFCARQRARVHGKLSVALQRVQKRRTERLAALLAECEADIAIARHTGRRKPDADAQAFRGH